MAITIVLNKRSGTGAPLSVEQIDANWDAIEAAFATANTGNQGSVTSVGLSMPAMFSVANSPVTTTGTLTATLATQAANRIFAGPSTGADAAPTFRAIVADDLPTVPKSKGGTGAVSFVVSRLIVSDGSGNLSSSSVTATEAGYLSGVTSAIQTQLNSKQATITVLAVANGGTGGNTEQTARASLLPTYAANAGKFLKVNAGATDVEWATVTGAIPTINSLSGALTIAVGSTGTDFAVASSGTTITINLPSASATNRGAITTGAQTIAGVKTFTSNPIINASTPAEVFYSGGSRDLIGDSTFTYDGATMSVPNIRQTTCTRIASTSSLETFDKYVILDQSAAIDVTLPAIEAALVGQTYVLKDIDGACATYNVTIKVASGDYLEGTINGTYVMSVNYEAIQVTALEVAASTYEWFITARYKVG
jgi:hypothetical protein